MTCFVTSGDSAALPMPTRPLSVNISQISQPWNVNVPIVSSDSDGAIRSIGFVQKCGGSGVVLPFHWTTRVRISVIFMSVACGAGRAPGFSEWRDR
jgi:hypothetical protein